MPKRRPLRSMHSSGRVDSKAVAAVSYIVFFVPLLVARDSKYAMYHANQGLLLFVFAVAVSVIGNVIPILGWFVIGPIGNIMIIIFAILGIINAASGKTKPLPLIGKFTLIS